MLKNIITIASDVISDVGHYFEELTGGMVCFVIMNVIDWQYEIIKFTMGIGASIISAYLVHKIKSKFWSNNPKEHKSNGKKNPHT